MNFENHCIEIAAVVLFGLCLGSFLNVVIIRLPRERSILSPPSRCGFCRTSLRFWMNIPVLSFLISGGRCCRCGLSYSIRYPIVELLAATVLLSIWYLYGVSSQGIFLALFTLALIAVSFIDLDWRIIPDSISIGGWILAIILSALHHSGFPVSLMESIAGSIGGAAFFLITGKGFEWLTGREGLGGGDVKLMGFIGAVIGIHGMITTVLFGSIFGIIVGVILAFCRRRAIMGYSVPFGPFLALGAFLHILQLDQWLWNYLEVVR